jgi:MinD-like ATPase involved in chromosome partitioning or flagellar assembly
MQTLKCTTITPDADLRNQLAAEIAGVEGAELVRGLTSYPEPENLVRFFRVSPARIVLLDARNRAAALRICRDTELSDPGMQFIAIGLAAAESGQPELSCRGVHEALELPLDPGALRAAIARRAQVLSKLPRVYQRRPSFVSFLPAKPGAGASTLAANFASLLSTEYKTLLSDFDLSSGTVGFRYRLDSPHTVSEMLNNIEHLDEDLWPQLVTNVNGLDILPSANKPAVAIDDRALPKLFDFLRTIYDIVVFDLSGSLESHALTIMHECSRVFVVSTQEVECLHIGRAKVAALREFGLQEHTRVLLNRVQKNHLLKRSEITDLLNTAVEAEFPNDYRAVQASLHAGTAVSPKSALAKALREFSPMLLRDRSLAPPKRFIEFASPSLFQFWRRDVQSEPWT